MCALSFEEAWDAAHVIPSAKSSPALRISPRNGILLCANHHKLFDSGWIGISEDYRILLLDESYHENEYSEADKAATGVGLVWQT